MEEKDIEILVNDARCIIKDIMEMESVDTEKSYRKIKSDMARQRRASFFRKISNVAAVLIVPLILFSSIMGYKYYEQNKSSREEYKEVYVSNGTVIKYQLPDKSVVWLNSGTVLRHPVQFEKGQRVVSIDGEGFFEVKTDKNAPFYVCTPHDVKLFVYGTKFNICAGRDDPKVETTLEEGKLNVIINNKEIPVSPGECLSYDGCNGEIIKANADVYEKTAWKDGKLIFRNATIEEVFKKLEKHFNCEISFNNHNNKEYRYRATFKGNETLTQILDYLAKSASFKWHMRDLDEKGQDNAGKKRISIDLY